MKWSWEVKLGIGLVVLSLSIYTTKYVLLGDANNTYQYVFNSLGFLPINVLLVTLIINQLLAIRAKRERLNKLNMVIGSFYSEVGTSLLSIFSDHDPGMDRMRGALLVQKTWSKEDFDRVTQEMKDHLFHVDILSLDLPQMKTILAHHRNFFLRLLENPVLLEHGPFTETLQAAFHFAEELSMRPQLQDLPAPDLEHLRGDVERVYRLIALEWIAYMKYLQQNYPYLFSLALRTNPFDQSASVVIRS
jgi:hypothetical protein